MKARHATIPALLLCALTLGAASHDTGDLGSLKGDVRIDGSSTVYPITEAVTEDFSQAAKGVRATVGVSGTGGGFKRFCKGEIDISDASRPISRSELETCKAGGLEFIELPIAYDALTVSVNRRNDWVKSLTLDQLKRIFGATGTARTWKDLDPAWPDRTIKVYSPGTDSGTFDYFKEVTVGKDGKMRADMSVSEDDNVLVNGVAGDQDAIGFFGFAYYTENREKIHPVAIDGGKGPVMPAESTILDGTYDPMSRPLFIYVIRKSADRAEVQAYVGFYLANAAKLARSVGYTALPEAIQAKAAANWKSRRTGTQFLDASGEKVTGTLTSVYK